jgi:hypothetical protein
MLRAFNEKYEEVQQHINQGADPSITEGIPLILRYFRSPSSIDRSIIDQYPHIQHQLKLGQGAFFAGLWTYFWAQQQYQYFTGRPKLQHRVMRWIITLMHKIQAIPKAMWAVRNNILHNTQDTLILQQKHSELDNIIDTIYSTKPHPRTMSHCDSLYYSKYTRTQIKNMKLQRKTNWVTGANLILTKYERSTTTQSKRFMSFFQWDRG